MERTDTDNNNGKTGGSGSSSGKSSGSNNGSGKSSSGTNSAKDAKDNTGVDKGGKNDKSGQKDTSTNTIDPSIIALLLQISEDIRSGKIKEMFLTPEKPTIPTIEDAINKTYGVTDGKITISQIAVEQATNMINSNNMKQVNVDSKGMVTYYDNYDVTFDFEDSLKYIDGMTLEDAIKMLTSPDYSPVYGQIKKVDYGVDTYEVKIPKATSDLIRSDSLASWDPRLSRIDGFLATDGGTNPTVIPFASNSASGAFFDMVFTIEKAVADKNPNFGDSAQNDDVVTGTSNSLATRLEDIDGLKVDVRGSEKIFKGRKKLINEIMSTGDSYGVASIMNPYTLTKLCGGLIKTGESDDDFSNHMYDVRDARRFYDKSVNIQGDMLSINNPTTTNIITYANRDPWGRTPYYFLDFVFCKFWNVIPNNRLITLRKYHAPVFDNLLFSSMTDGGGDAAKIKHTFAPIATVVSYFGDDTGNTLSSLLSFTTGTKWRDLNAQIHNVTGESGSDPHSVIDGMFENGGGFPTGSGNNIVSNIMQGANMLTEKVFSLGKFIGLLSPGGYNIGKDKAVFDTLSLANVDPYENLYSNKIQGPVNRVDSTKARDAGIVFDQKLNIVCLYISRPIGGVNTKAAMLDILSNCLEIASVDAIFWGGGYHFNIKPHMYPFKNNDFKNRIMDDLYAGRIFGNNGALAHTVQGIKSFGLKDGKGEFSWDNVVSNIGDILGQTLGAIGEILTSVGSALFGDSSNIMSWLGNAADKLGAAAGGEGGEAEVQKGKNKLNSLFTNLNDMWRANVIKKSVMPSVNGMKALLTGEAVGNWHLTVGNPLNPIMTVGNLICSDMKVEWGEELGPDDFPTELKVTYTVEHGMARDKSGIQSMFNRGNGRIYQLPDWIRATSDYETKVDNYTGPSSSGWKSAKYMSAGSVMAQGGTGFLTYKFGPTKALAVNQNTNNTVIAKFTPPDVDAAVSNVKNMSNTFFSANATSRAWIRGHAATRKLMN